MDVSSWGSYQFIKDIIIYTYGVFVSMILFYAVYKGWSGMREGHNFFAHAKKYWQTYTLLGVILLTPAIIFAVDKFLSQGKFSQGIFF